MEPFAFIKLMRHSRRAKKHPGNRLVGLTGRAESEIADDGIVFVRGELWRASSRLMIAYGERVCVVGFSEAGVSLIVERAGAVR